MFIFSIWYFWRRFWVVDNYQNFILFIVTLFVLNRINSYQIKKLTTMILMFYFIRTKIGAQIENDNKRNNKKLSYFSKEWQKLYSLMSEKEKTEHRLEGKKEKQAIIDYQNKKLKV